jgi:hypothetical protein
MNQPEARKTLEGIGDGFRAHFEVPQVFFNPCIEAVIRDENDGRAKETPALPPPNHQSGVPIVCGSTHEVQEVRCRSGLTDS